MASIARDNLDVIRIPRKAILPELIKKLGGCEAEYECWFEDGRYFSVARTYIATAEANTSSRLQQAMGSLEATKESAEEAAASALIQVLKRTYRFEIDDINLMERAKAEHRNEQLQKQAVLSMSMEKMQIERVEKLTKCWNQLVDDMDFVREACHDICDVAAATLPVGHSNSPLTDMIYSVGCLEEWTEQKIYENINRINETGKINNISKQ